MIFLWKSVIAVKIIWNYSETSIKRTPNIIKQTPSIKWTLSRVSKLMSYIFLYNEPLLSGHLY